jgi:hypothetical protein
MKVLKSSAHKLELSKKRRDLLRSQDLCINGKSHGKATHGRLCKSCRKTHNRKMKETNVEQAAA